jgi:hypothetical protein
MIVPEYWAEAKERVVVNNKARTYKRFGWSDVSSDDALDNARERVAEAAAQARRGESVRLVDHKLAYNGAEGLPIREEIIERHGDAVVTRNSYGALCLNTPDVLFADVDVPQERYANYGWGVLGVFLAAGILAALYFEEMMWIVGAIVMAIIFAAPIGRLIYSLTAGLRIDPFDTALAKIEAYAQKHSSWVMRIYRTPRGYRVLVMHQTFAPDSQEAQQFMKAIGGDPLYAVMCRNQNCFRARVSPKPWRVGIEHIRPRPGVWPIKTERMADRRRWVQRYDDNASAYASCRFIKSLGQGRNARPCESVRIVHDRKCKADSSLPLA